MRRPSILHTLLIGTTLLTALLLLAAFQNQNPQAYNRQPASTRPTVGNANKQPGSASSQTPSQNESGDVSGAVGSMPAGNNAETAGTSDAQQRFGQAQNPPAPSAQQQQQHEQGIQLLQSQYGNNAALQKTAQDAVHPGVQPDGSVVGIIGDSKCGRMHWDRPGLGPAGCARWCVEHGASYILISNTTIYKLSGNMKLIDNFAGEPVQIKGSVGGGSINVQSIAHVDLPVGNTIQPKAMTKY